MFGQVAYLADVLRPHLPGWAAVSIFMVPIILIVAFQPDDHVTRLRWVRIAHTVAALWYGLVAVGVELASALGHVPDGALFFRILMHTGWLPLVAVLRQRLSGSESS